MTSHVFQVGDVVEATRAPMPGTGRVGRVVSFNDWWVMVRMNNSNVVYPYMESELASYVERNSLSHLERS